MSTSYRRFEILLPRRFNDGRPIPRELALETVMELRRRFGAVSCETQTIRGEWESHGGIYRDELARVFVDVPDTPESRQFFLQHKERLKERFQQIDIWMTTYPVEVL